ncbi:hypothetical protein C3Y87_00470 [Carbonactinospora thermoautotrophica]|uniref:Secreted protein n=1 Tax=Carbonactinospora thermoautotrophica TaxID=1469144 RepID=A0A132MVV2_9ACTN|nr:hypothetical protein [Carbonactinospora thermoautotrophica]KWX00080.1 hypothetical protein TH66_14145 [Carbonactinospora thermoautotrophica]KWX01981.1 Uncharacterized protein LI90_3016 [Carbonactinospora thermoautotrophica]KWX09113.1 hypothetical protein TR74_11540 [Carbonactinospora thermoautotrophica]MCX9189918.1 hypothetical protein [Carbonactinospora thermoautotrophica]
MPTWVVILIIAAVVVLLLLALFFFRQRTARQRHLKERFGPEYDRAVEAHDSRAQAERDLTRREERHERLELRPLPPATRDRYAQEWTRIQERFVDAPDRTVEEADRLVTALMAERGYPTEGYEQRIRDLSVEHAQTLDHYRVAHEISVRNSRREASTEDQRRALVHYRELFAELL